MDLKNEWMERKPESCFKCVFIDAQSTRRMTIYMRVESTQLYLIIPRNTVFDMDKRYVLLVHQTSVCFWTIDTD